MKSMASLKGHPLHPILICFPIAFFIGTAVADYLGYFYDESFHLTALYLEIAGIATALVAAVPGIIDFKYRVPPKSSGKKRAAMHGVLNTLVVLIFGAALYYRLRADEPTATVILALESIALVPLFIAGWIGGTLVYRNQIGVDHRFAGAGKWEEQRLAPTDGEIEISGAGKLERDQMRLLHVNGHRIVIARTEQGLAAFDDRCTHRGASLADGMLICGTVQCPWHGSQFDVNSGEVKAGPGRAKIRTYKITEKNGKFYLTI